jgi:hypothetical protein
MGFQNKIRRYRTARKCVHVYIYLFTSCKEGTNMMMKSNPIKVYRYFRANTIVSIRCLSAQVVVASICEVQEN